MQLQWVSQDQDGAFASWMRRVMRAHSLLYLLRSQRSLGLPLLSLSLSVSLTIFISLLLAKLTMRQAPIPVARLHEQTQR